MIDLEDYIGKKVKVELKSGDVYFGTVERVVDYGCTFYDVVPELSGFTVDGRKLFTLNLDEFMFRIEEIEENKITHIEEMKYRKIEEPEQMETIVTTLEVNINHTKEDFGYTLSSDQNGTVTLTCTEGLEAMTGTTNHIHIPKYCIQHIITALEKFQ